jgi:hypothetical protein
MTEFIIKLSDYFGSRLQLYAYGMICARKLTSLCAVNMCTHIYSLLVGIRSPAPLVIRYHPSSRRLSQIGSASVAKATDLCQSSRKFVVLHGSSKILNNIKCQQIVHWVVLDVIQLSLSI